MIIFKVPSGELSKNATKEGKQPKQRSKVSNPEAPSRPPLPNSSVRQERNGAEASSRSSVTSIDNSQITATSEAQSRPILPNGNEPILPSYAEACSEDNSSSTIYPNIHSVVRNGSARNNQNLSDSDVNAFLDSMLNEHVQEDATSPSAQELLDVLLTINNVQIYFISPSGMVSAPSYPDALRIVSSGDSNSNSALLQVGSWTYPLFVGQSPTLQCDTGCYIFPDISSQEPGMFIFFIFFVSCQFL